MSTPAERPAEHWDVAVVGSGFGGSVAALRLAEKGYRVLVVESGRRFRDDELPKTSWRLPKFLWAPAVGMFGIQRLTLLNDVLVLSGAGVGGGSLVYGNTLYEPLDDFYADKQWSHITDWRDELAPHYMQAKRMLGVVENPVDTPADRVMREVASDLGVADTFHRTNANVGVLFGDRPGQDVDDPFFGGAGPARTTCISCGSCMTGCRVGAKNTLPKNYLHLAEGLGATIRPLTTVTEIAPRDAGGYRVAMRAAGPGAGVPARSEVTADHVILAAGTLGTQMILHTMKDLGVLPNISDRLGELTRTNSESILPVEARDITVDYSVGPAITSSIHPNPQTHVEPVRYGRGSNFMGMLSTLPTEGNRPDQPGGARWKRFVRAAVAEPGSFLRSVSVRRWSQRTTVMLVMQSLDNSLNVSLKRGPFGMRTLSTRQGTGQPNPTWIPEAHDVAKRFAAKTGGGGPRHPDRDVRHPDDRPHPGRCPDRGHPADRRDRPLAARLRSRGHARRRRCGGQRQPGCEPVADDHCAGRAGDVVLAQQGRVGPPPRAGGRLSTGPRGASRRTGRARGRTRRAGVVSEGTARPAGAVLRSTSTGADRRHHPTRNM